MLRVEHLMMKFDRREEMNMKYKTVVLDFETTGLDFETDEILQVSIIDGNNNILMNEYCKPKFKKSW